MVCNNVILILPYYPHGKLLHELVITLPYNDLRDHWGRLQNSKLPKLKQNSRQTIDSHLASTNLLA